MWENAPDLKNVLTSRNKGEDNDDDGIQDTTYVRACPGKEQRRRRRRRELAELALEPRAQVGITVTKERNNEDKTEEQKY